MQADLVHTATHPAGSALASQPWLALFICLVSFERPFSSLETSTPGSGNLAYVHLCRYLAPAQAVAQKQAASNIKHMVLPD
mmetsp:Transcript_8798/g.26457  ORF Transcript_8798/g.26457 Transcript_8798/m.26457 type:complete len:81 (-) Transcript_8798:728-970(-)